MSTARKSEVVTLRFGRTELRDVDRAAARQGLSRASWVRSAALGVSRAGQDDRGDMGLNGEVLERALEAAALCGVDLKDWAREALSFCAGLPQFRAPRASLRMEPAPSLNPPPIAPVSQRGAWGSGNGAGCP